MVILRNLLVLLAWFGACQAADTSVFSYTAADGSVSLSNVPTDTRFTLLISDKSARPTTSGRTIRSPRARDEHDEVIGRVATRYGLDSALLHALITVESGYDAAASSSKGAQGLMQLMPGTAKRYGVADAFDPAQNVDGGARYLRDLLKLFDGDLSLVLAAYNAGENAVLRNQNRIPPFRETLEYVPKVLALYRRNQGM